MKTCSLTGFRHKPLQNSAWRRFPEAIARYQADPRCVGGPDRLVTFADLNGRPAADGRSQERLAASPGPPPGVAYGAAQRIGGGNCTRKIEAAARLPFTNESARADAAVRAAVQRRWQAADWWRAAGINPRADILVADEGAHRAERNTFNGGELRSAVGGPGGDDAPAWAAGGSLLNHSTGASAPGRADRTPSGMVLSRLGMGFHAGTAEGAAGRTTELGLTPLAGRDSRHNRLRR